MSVSAATSAAAAVIQATRALGVIVQVAPESFMDIVRRQENPLVVHAKGGVFTPNYQYLTSYKGLAFFTKSPTELGMPFGVEVIPAKSIWIPS